MLQPGPNARGLFRAPAAESPKPTLQRWLSIDGLGSSIECVDPGRGEVGRRPKVPVKLEGHPPLLSLLKRPNARLLGGTAEPASADPSKLGPWNTVPEILLFLLRAVESKPDIMLSALGIELALLKGGPSSDIVLFRCLIPNIPLNLLVVPPLGARFDRTERMERRSASMRSPGEPRLRLF